MKLRKLRYEDIEYILEWMKDEELNQFFRFNSNEINLDTIKKFISNALEDKGNLHLAIADEKDEYLGTVSLKNISDTDKNAEYAIALRRKAIGTNTAAFATSEIIRIAFEELNLYKVYLNVLSFNLRAIRFYEKMGFVYEGEFVNHIMIRGRFSSLRWYAKFNNKVGEVLSNE
jgi:RimJ/RimL family protein N-acetyltransferase